MISTNDCIHQFWPGIKEKLHLIYLASSKAVQSTEFQELYDVHHQELARIRPCSSLASCIVRTTLKNNNDDDDKDLQLVILEYLLSNPCTPGELYEQICLTTPPKILCPIITSLNRLKQRDMAIDGILQLWTRIFGDKLDFDITNMINMSW